MAEKKPRPLTARELRFVQAWMVCGNQTQAAEEAGYSKKTAKSIGWQLMQRPEVRAAIQEAQARTAELAGVTAVMVAQELKRIAFSDMSEFVEWGPSRMRLKDSDDVDGRCVAEVSETITEAGGSKRIKLHDKKGALDSLNKMLGFNAAEKLEHTGKNGGPIEVEVSDAKQRLAQRLARLNRTADPGDARGADGRGS